MSNGRFPQLPDYDIRACLARGGMAEVYLADVLEGPLRDTQVVLKRLHPKHAHETAYVDLFVAEARLGETLVHPNIVQTYELIHHQEEHFSVHEFVAGCTLARLMAESGQGSPLSLGARLSAFHDLLEALAYLQTPARSRQGKGVVHRDVNPENLIVRSDGVCKLTDFGVAEVEGEAHEERAGLLRGTPAYMSPEQARGRVLDIRSDLFSAGIVLWELLTNRPLHREATEFETMRRICEEDAARPSVFAPEVPAVFDPLVGKALARDRDQRFSSARSMLTELDAAREQVSLGLDPKGLASAVERIRAN